MELPSCPNIVGLYYWTYLLLTAVCEMDAGIFILEAVSSKSSKRPDDIYMSDTIQENGCVYYIASRLVELDSRFCIYNVSSH